MVGIGGMMLMAATYALIASILLASSASATSIAQIPITKATFPDCYWLPSSFSECAYPVTSDDGAPCGQGVQTRDVTCYCDGKRQGDTSVCTAVGLEPSANQVCSVQCHSSSWVPTAWQGCTVECGTGYESRAVSCQTEEGTKVEGSHCPTDPKLLPEESQKCAAPLCTPQHGNMTWNWGEWTQCSASCGTGHETRDRWCVGPDGIIDDTNCDCDAVSTFRSCNLGPCETFRWSETSFGDCSVECGTGYQTREVTCISSQRGLVANSECTAALGPHKSSTVQLCHNKPCPHYGWEPRGWSDCSVTCGKGEETQEVDCVELTTGTIVAAEYCILITPVPASVQSCVGKQSVCERWHWHVGSWGGCGATCGEAGTASRIVTCVGWYPTEDSSSSSYSSSSSLYSSDYVDVDPTETKCLGARPDAYEACNPVPACPVCSYEPNGFHSCSVACGGGTQEQTAGCYCDDTGTVAQSDSRCVEQKALITFPLSQKCNTGSCCTPNWQYTSYSPCSATCGVGYETRSATCECDESGASAPGDCDKAELLDTQRTCEDAKCPLPYPQPSPWSDCSVTCGVGVVTRTVKCVLNTHGVDTVVADDQCWNITAYATSDTCIPGVCTTYEEKYTPYSACSATCEGTQYRTAYCESSKGLTVDNSNCPGIPTLPLQQDCNTQTCPIYVPRSGNWSECSVTCDSGVKTLEWYCFETVSQTVVEDTYCPTLVPGSAAYPNIQACSEVACTTCQWIPGSWSGCSAECGAGSYSREVPCKCSDGSVDSTRCSGARPDQQKDCVGTTCHSYHPHISSWGKCSASCGNDGVQTRTVECLREDDVSVDLSFCSLTVDSYSTVQHCFLCACENTTFNAVYRYEVSGFGACDVSCGSGHQHQSVGCTVTLYEIDQYDDGRPDDVYIKSTTSVPAIVCEIALGQPIPPTVKDCVLPTCVPPSWVPGIPSCDVTCGDGVQTRTVVCKLNGVTVDDSQCTDAKPWTASTCSTPACETWRWNVTGWSDCSVTCGTGIHQRTVQCISSVWGSVTVDNCVAYSNVIGPKPDDHEDCLDVKCKVCVWEPSSWSDCSVTCGQGATTRAVPCVCSDGSSDGCIGVGYDTSAGCTEPTCPEHFHWVPRNWTGCDATCGKNGVETREVVCVGDFGTVDETGLQCTDLLKPDTVRPCVEVLPECIVCHPVYSSYSKCSVTCGLGIETRTVSYANQYGQTVDVSVCGDQVLPLEPLLQDCVEDGCPHCTWQVASFSTCTVSCGVGAQTRDVACIDQYGGVCASNQCAGTAPVRSDECELACCTSYSWHTGPYGDCSLTCGSGTRTRDVYCHDTEGLVVDASYCEGAAPSTDELCAGGNTLTCDDASWANNDWSECSASCGAGTRTRDVWCRAPNGARVADSQCSGEAPASSDKCNLCGCESLDWEVTSWSECSVSCGQGFITREVECRSTLRGYVSFSECTEKRPHDHQVCAPVCYSYVPGEYGACTEGTQSRNVYCVGTNNKLSQDGSHCAGQVAPQESQSCGPV